MFEGWKFYLPESDQFGPMRITADVQTICKMMELFLEAEFHVGVSELIKVRTQQFPSIAEELAQRGINITYACGTPSWICLKIDTTIPKDLEEAFFL